MSQSFCKHGIDLFRHICPKCSPDYTDGRGIAHTSADILARFEMNLTRVQATKPKRRLSDYPTTSL